MTPSPGKHVVVVDGSNLATEGRTTPSLRQLDDAVRAYAAEDPDADIVVVVDASFEHRIDPAERQQLIDAELHGEIVSPPAGAIGRGDAFVLRIAERTGARVLSNDSFQEFHAEHPWLFDKGRLVGGKPVPGVGWIFTPRIPVRGPKSRQASGKAKGDKEDTRTLSPPVKAAELARAAKKVAARKVPVLPDGSTPKVGDVWPAGAPGTASTEETKKKSKKGGARVSSAKDVKKEATGEKPRVDKAASGGAATPVAAPGKKVAPAKSASARATNAKKEPAKKPVAKKEAAKKARAKVAGGEAAVDVAPKNVATKEADQKKPERSEPTAKKASAKKPGAKKASARGAPPKKVAAEHADVEVGEKKEPAKKESARQHALKKGATAAARAAPKKATVSRLTPDRAVKARSARNTAAKNPVVQEAIGQAIAEAIAPSAEPNEDGRRGRGDQKRGKQDGKQEGKHDGKGGRQRRRRPPSPPPAVNEPLAFITFVANYPLDSQLEGQVVSFTSHGAMVDVDLPGGGVLHSYIPLSAMGDPPPTKARQLLTRGERRQFLLVALDPPRRVAELALPEAVSADSPTQR